MSFLFVEIIPSMAYIRPYNALIAIDSFCLQCSLVLCVIAAAAGGSVDANVHCSLTNYHSSAVRVPANWLIKLVVACFMICRFYLMFFYF